LRDNYCNGDANIVENTPQNGSGLIGPASIGTTIVSPGLISLFDRNHRLPLPARDIATGP